MIAAFVFQHILLGIKLILAEAIDDVPEWVPDDADANENRVLQAEASISDKKLMERLGSSYSVEALLDDVFGGLHHDRQMAALLVPKLKQGCLDWLKQQQLGETGASAAASEGRDPNFRHASRGAQAEKLRQVLSEL